MDAQKIVARIALAAGNRQDLVDPAVGGGDPVAGLRQLQGRQLRRLEMPFPRLVLDHDAAGVFGRERDGAGRPPGTDGNRHVAAGVIDVFAGGGATSDFPSITVYRFGSIDMRPENR